MGNMSARATMREGGGVSTYVRPRKVPRRMAPNESSMCTLGMRSQMARGSTPSGRPVEDVPLVAMADGGRWDRATDAGGPV